MSALHRAADRIAAARDGIARLLREGNDPLVLCEYYNRMDENLHDTLNLAQAADEGFYDNDALIGLVDNAESRAARYETMLRGAEATDWTPWRWPAVGDKAVIANKHTQQNPHTHTPQWGKTIYTVVAVGEASIVVRRGANGRQMIYPAYSVRVID